jgi:hypothetical protein
MIEIENILSRTSLIEEIKKQAQTDNGSISLLHNEQLSLFIKQLENNITASSNNDWKENNQLLNLLNKLPSQLLNQSNSGEKGMMTETKVAITTGGTLLLIGVAVGIYYAKKCADKRDDTGLFNKVRNTLDKVLNPANSNSDTIEIITPIYDHHHLLLVIPANQCVGLTSNTNISNTQVNKLIANAVRAYCFLEGNLNGNKISEAVKCSDEAIDFTTGSRVFVHLKLSADKSITEQRNTLNIIAKIKPDSTIEVVKIAKLQEAISTKEFYEI